MINRTLDFYNNNSKTYIESTLSVDMSHLYNDFLKHIAKCGHILDLGCGSGRDSLEFIKQGYNVTAVDGSKELSIAASKLIEQEVICSKFEELQLTEKFHGIWACASLLHINKRDLIQVIKNISSNLEHNGVFYMSFKYGENEYIDEKGRYFNYYTEETFKEMLSQVPNLKIKTIYKSGDTLGGRNNLVWLNIILEIR
ncbi:MAG: class I SAM-dependent methyltransferase [Bacilli bacterium]|nr:class I SAM-dependent methyltransferase [Bacilli bacterium]